MSVWLTPAAGMLSKDTAAKQLDVPKKFCRHVEPTSSTASCLTDPSCLSEKPLRTRAMMSLGDGFVVPFVLSDHTNVSAGSYTSANGKIGTEVPRPF